MQLSTPSRRRVLGLLGTGVAGTLAGCSDRLIGGESTPTAGTQSATDTETVTPTATVTPTPSRTPTSEGVTADGTFGVAGDETAFGTSLDLSADGRTAVVGGTGSDTTHRPPEPGAAYVFERSDGEWQRIAELTFPGDDDDSSTAEGDDGSRFGSPVAISAAGDRCFVSDPHVGEVHAYERSGSGFERRATITPPDADGGFGERIDVAADGTTVAIAEDTGNESTGRSIHLFGGPDGGWSREAVLPPDRASADTWREHGSTFGVDVVLAGDGASLLVGSTDAESPDGSAAGAAYLYRRRDGEWTDPDVLGPDVAADHDAYGAVVALSPDGRTALVGAHDLMGPERLDTTTTYVFTAEADAWTVSELAPTHRYAAAALSGDGTGIVGHRETDGTDRPLASLLRRGADWRRDAVLVTPQSHSWTDRSAALSADGSTALVGQGTATGEQEPPAPVYAYRV